MPHETTIVEAEGVEEEEISVSRWQNYGKDRLYINKFGKSHDSVFADLDGDEGHSTWAGASIDVDGNRVEIEWTERGIPRSADREPRQKRAVLEVAN